MAPKRVENTPGELVEEIPPPYETTQVPKLKTKLGYWNFPGLRSPYTASANRKGISTFHVQHQCATLAPPQLQRLHPSSNHTPLLAVQAIGRVSSFLEALLPLILRLAVHLNRCAWEGLFSQVSPSDRLLLFNHPEDERL